MAKNRVKSFFACRLCRLIGPHKVDLFGGDSRGLRATISELYGFQVGHFFISSPIQANIRRFTIVFRIQRFGEVTNQRKYAKTALKKSTNTK